MSCSRVNKHSSAFHSEKQYQLTRFTFIEVWLRNKWETFYAVLLRRQEICMCDKHWPQSSANHWSRLDDVTDERSLMSHQKSRRWSPTAFWEGKVYSSALCDRSETCMRTRWVTEKLMCCERGRSHFSIKRVDRFIGKGIRWCTSAEKTCFTCLSRLIYAGLTGRLTWKI